MEYCKTVRSASAQHDVGTICGSEGGAKRRRTKEYDVAEG